MAEKQITRITDSDNKRFPFAGLPPRGAGGAAFPQGFPCASDSDK